MDLEKSTNQLLKKLSKTSKSTFKKVEQNK
jgi:hypothetical protein